MLVPYTLTLTEAVLNLSVSCENNELLLNPSETMRVLSKSQARLTVMLLSLTIHASLMAPSTTAEFQRVPVDQRLPSKNHASCINFMKF